MEALKEAAGEAIGTLGAGKRTEILETIGMLTSNLEKIAEHGRRADGIVRGMLQHSRGLTAGLAYSYPRRFGHFACLEGKLDLPLVMARPRTQDQDFKVALELDLDRKLAPIEIVSQDVSRVLLNLMSNGFYAITKRGLEDDGAFRPLLRIATRRFGEGVEIRVRDNGVGIPLEFREKLFQPFFTTKPTGEGNMNRHRSATRSPPVVMTFVDGIVVILLLLLLLLFILLSLLHVVVGTFTLLLLLIKICYFVIILFIIITTAQRGGTITVDSEVGGFTEFTVWLPRRRRAVAG